MGHGAEGVVTLVNGKYVRRGDVSVALSWMSPVSQNCRVVSLGPFVFRYRERLDGEVVYDLV